ncbi:hypothetical protein CKW39_07845 [Kocuria sp. WRN011]|uniref:DUF2617 family protein n=1 Tax=Kocuria sp. WRN011 TaxID=2029858 RepID=UPI000BB04737|nr:DUF2617 family protein [Kocuria sp. WRN011]PBB08289.1 hypothetical protein CKW39_07845 [Kocuria sp. WRN011]
MNRPWLTRTPGHVVCEPDEFSYRTDLPVVEATATRSYAIDELTTVELRVAPGQHQLVITHGDDHWVETIGLFDDAAPDLPILRRLPNPTGFATDFEVGCTVTSHSQRGLVKTLKQLRDRLDNAPLALCVQDPEEPTAITAACCHMDPVENTLMWWTWRTLPESGCMVRTRAQLHLTAVPQGVAA